MSLFVAGKKNGAFVRENVNFLNEKSGRSLGLSRSAVGAFDEYFRNNGISLEAGKDVIFKLVPYRVRKDKNGKIRLGKRVR